MTIIHVEQGDLTTYALDAIVNAANNDLKLGGGIAGAIARKGGSEIQAQCDRHGPVRLGEAAVTDAGELPAKYVIHQASMKLGGRTTAKSLKDSTRAVLELAEQYKIRSLGFPATGTGAAGFDTTQAARIMIGEVVEHVAAETCLRDVYFVLVDDLSYEIFRRTFEEIANQRVT